MRLARLLLVGAAALAPIMHAPGASVAAAAARSPFIAPQSDVILARTVIRELSDGKKIVVTRRYRVHFVAVSGGYRLDGVLIDVAVDAPPVLSSLADIERKRVDTGLFPLELDGQGLIRGRNSGPVDQETRQRTVSSATQAVGASALGSGTKRETNDLIGQTVLSVPNSPWPADLFNPEPGERRMQREVAMPDGSNGLVIVVMRVGARLPCGLPQQVEREVTTVLAGTQRVSREVYTLAQPGA